MTMHVPTLSAGKTSQANYLSYFVQHSILNQRGTYVLKLPGGSTLRDYTHYTKATSGNAPQVLEANNKKHEKKKKKKTPGT